MLRKNRCLPKCRFKIDRLTAVTSFLIPVFLHTCATSSELPSDIRTINTIIARVGGQIKMLPHLTKINRLPARLIYWYPYHGSDGYSDYLAHI